MIRTRLYRHCQGATELEYFPRLGGARVRPFMKRSVKRCPREREKNQNSGVLLSTPSFSQESLQTDSNTNRAI